MAIQDRSGKAAPTILEIDNIDCEFQRSKIQQYQSLSYLRR